MLFSPSARILLPFIVSSTFYPTINIRLNL